MKQLWILITILVLAASCGGTREASQAPGQEEQAAADDEKSQSSLSPQLLADYAEIQRALAADQFEEAKQAASKLAETGQGQVAQLAAEAAQASQISELRKAFVALSEKVIELGGDLGGYKVAFCPMANDSEGARWLQKDGPIRNPYYGSGMLECGYFPEPAE